ncbi:tyrosine-type recombinase/integrase [Vibrio quintilis]|uniref:Tyrosine recombinase XerD n=1 Tax=Vibrio quintilis TaxID=1117707 RepID=A0A1M7YQX2_9VIBR|nr:tyrosine-type recombinase/integrase [Vibrio quintilis]SHO54926.1 Tyrosine recombinase XerD [Vibrio quintilis]
MIVLGQVVQDYLLFCEKNRGLSTHSIKAYHCDLKQFISCLGIQTEIYHIDKVALGRFHQHLVSRELNPASIKRKFACIRAMFKWLEQEEILDSNPFYKFHTEIKLPKRLPRNVPRSDLKRMLLQGHSHVKDKVSAHLTHKRQLNHLTKLLSAELMIATGLRVGELASIHMSNIFLAEGKIKILGKGSRERFVFLPEQELRDLIKNYLYARQITEPQTDHLLVNSRGQQASTQFLRKLIRDLSSEAKTQTKVTPHMLRHSAACELLESGLDIRFVQRLLGHSSISTTEIYTHVSDTALQEKLQQAQIRSRIMVK